MWLTKKTKAEVDYIDEKLRVEAEFLRAKTAYEAAKAEWHRVRAGG